MEEVSSNIEVVSVEKVPKKRKAKRGAKLAKTPKSRGNPSKTKPTKAIKVPTKAKKPDFELVMQAPPKKPLQSVETVEKIAEN